MIFNIYNGSWYSVYNIMNNNPGFGMSISAYENYLIISSPYYNNNEGAVYFYEILNSNWSNYSNINANWSVDSNTSISLGGNGGGQEGITVSMYGNYAVAGAPAYDNFKGDSILYLSA